MASDNDAPLMGPLKIELAKMKKATLKSAERDVDRIIQLLESAREQVASGESGHRVLFLPHLCPGHASAN
jgi:hypothetical protein